MTKIVATARTRNEARNVERFCYAYGQFCDMILLADGGSTDDTISIARRQPKTLMREFEDRVFFDDGVWRNPTAGHINFLIEWAEAEGADWIIFDDCDDVPTVALQKSARLILDSCSLDFVRLHRLYVLGEDRYYPYLNDPGQSLWAWRAGVHQRAMVDPQNPTFHQLMVWPGDTLAENLEVPLCCLHYGWPDDETVDRKTAFYRATGELPPWGNAIPDNAGAAVELPHWARWTEDE